MADTPVIPPFIETNAAPATILVVDDTQLNLLLVSKMLDGHYRTMTADNGPHALQLAAADPQPDLILLDVMMPVMDGYEVIQHLRANPRTRDIPVIFVTARVAEEDEQCGLALGAVDYITKPLRAPILMARLRTQLELKRARDLLRNQNAILESRVMERTTTLRAILDSADQSIVMLAASGIIFAINRVGAEQMASTPSAMVGRDFYSLLPSDFAAKLRQIVAEVIASEQQAELKEVRDGRTLHSTVFPVPATPPRVVIYTEDISDFLAAEMALRLEHEQLAAALEQQRQLNSKLEEAQMQLVQSEKMASLGQLAAGVAHELNNPIGFVHSNFGTLEGYIKDIFQIVKMCEDGLCRAGDPTDFAALEAQKQRMDFNFVREDVFQLMAESKDGLLRVRQIVQNLKDFSRQGEMLWQWADIHAGLDSTLSIVWNELKYKCTVVKHYADYLPQINCLPSQLNQVFMNLLINAAHAIEEKGEITISTEAVDDDKIRIRISDTGHGIPPEHLKRIFEPFFTTKPIGKGTGLGLSIAYGIIGKHQGSIEVESKLNEGTTFIITLPINPATPGLTDENGPDQVAA